MRHDPAGASIVIMLRSLKLHGMAHAVDDLVAQGAPAFEAATPMLSQLLKAEMAEREVRSIAYQTKVARFPSYKDLAGFEFKSSDINEATVDDWDALPGFGPVLSRRTVKFREALRGFASVDQLHMVYGLDSATVLGVRGRLHADAKDIRPMCMDSLSFRFLVKHPLFDATATRNVLRAWGRGAVSMDVFWARLNASVEEREKWAPYLHICEPPTHVHK